VQRDRYQQIRKIFLEAVLREKEDRTGFFEDACGDDSDLKREVEELLRHHDALEQGEENS
jgi:hypothetical protein